MCLVFLFTALFLFSYFLSLYCFNSAGPLQNSKNIFISKGGENHVIQILQENNIIHSGIFSKYFFKLSLFITRKSGKIHAQELDFPAHVSIEQVLQILRHSPPLLHYFTVPEGLTAHQIDSIINHVPGLTGDLIITNEGEIFPQTYSYIWNEQRKNITDIMKNLMNKKLTEIWNSRDKKEIDSFIHSQKDLLILASLIEKESSISAEKPIIARVFLNRLKLNMRLQTDPTVIYGITHGVENMKHSLSHKDIITLNDYNTYKINGLPPGPICSPSEETLYAAAHPSTDKKLLYFVANGTGGHNFSENIKEQNKNINIYKKVINNKTKF